VQVLERMGFAWNIQVPANLPARSAITPLTGRALSIAAPGQAELSREWARVQK
jgi:stearoyl-CoA desaturase (delta-9 desaturase)